MQRNDRAMITHICSIKPEDMATVRSSELLAKFELEDLNLILRERGFRWFEHVERSSGAVRAVCDIQIDGMSKLTWKKLTEKDYSEWSSSRQLTLKNLKGPSKIRSDMDPNYLQWLSDDTSRQRVKIRLDMVSSQGSVSVSI